ncbi:hypothetical protein ACLESD_09875 [Pyxidicoccus sp. 3LFB2]
MNDEQASAVSSGEQASTTPGQERNGDVELIAGMLAEYSKKLREAYDFYEHERTRLFAGVAGGALMLYAAILSLMTVFKSGGTSSWFLFGSIFSVALGMVPLWFAMTSLMRRERARAEVSVFFSTLERLVRRASETYARQSLPFAQRLMLDVRLSEAEALLYRKRTFSREGGKA